MDSAGRRRCIPPRRAARRMRDRPDDRCFGSARSDGRPSRPCWQTTTGRFSPGFDVLRHAAGCRSEHVGINIEHRPPSRGLFRSRKSRPAPADSAGIVAGGSLPMTSFQYWSRTARSWWQTFRRLRNQLCPKIRRRAAGFRASMPAFAPPVRERTWSSAACIGDHLSSARRLASEVLAMDDVPGGKAQPFAAQRLAPAHFGFDRRPSETAPLCPGAAGRGDSHSG